MGLHRQAVQHQQKAKHVPRIDSLWGMLLAGLVSYIAVLLGLIAQQLRMKVFWCLGTSLCMQGSLLG